MCSLLFKFHNKTISRGDGGSNDNNELLIVDGCRYCSLPLSTRVKHIKGSLFLGETKHSNNVNNAHTVMCPDFNYYHSKKNSISNSTQILQRAIYCRAYTWSVMAVKNLYPNQYVYIFESALWTCVDICITNSPLVHEECRVQNPFALLSLH